MLWSYAESLAWKHLLNIFKIWTLLCVCVWVGDGGGVFFKAETKQKEEGI